VGLQFSRIIIPRSLVRVRPCPFDLPFLVGLSFYGKFAYTTVFLLCLFLPSCFYSEELFRNTMILVCLYYSLFALFISALEFLFGLDKSNVECLRRTVALDALQSAHQTGGGESDVSRHLMFQCKLSAHSPRELSP
jgi:hypothetical protein